MAERRVKKVEALRVAYVTANVFKPVGGVEEGTAKDAMVDLLFEGHQLFGATLHAYSVVRRHIRFLSVLPATYNAESFGNLIRLSIAERILPAMESGSVGTKALDSALWTRGFGHVDVQSESRFWKRIISIHMDPVRAELVQEPEEYRWSSAALFAAGHWDAEEGLMGVAERWAEIQQPYLSPSR